jgi:acyl-CoA synthetase (AMP-forming)/AMP-acid ligase II
VLHYLEAKRHQPYRTDDVVVTWLPLYHDLGLMSGLLAPQVYGIRTVLMSPLHWVRDPKILLAAITEFGGTMTYMPNFALNHSVRGIRERDLDGIDLSSCHALVLGGEPVRAPSLRAFAERFGPHGFSASAFRTGYGMAEVVEAATVSMPGTAPPVDWIDLAALQRDGRAVSVAPESAGAVALVSCGRALPGTELRIVNDAGAGLPERRCGEVIIRSLSMLREYLGRGDLSAETIRDGWLHSGDLGYLAGDQLYVMGRKKDVIIVGGKNVHPDDLERIADDVPGLHPGRTVAFGVADDRLGSEFIVMVCETAGEVSPERCGEIERDLRRRVVQEMDVALGEVRFVGRGWVIKTSSGKNARPDNRAKYLREFRLAAPDASGAPPA